MLSKKGKGREREGGGEGGGEGGRRGGSGGSAKRHRAQELSCWALHQSHFLFLAFSTVTPSGHRSTGSQIRLASNHPEYKEESIQLLCPLHLSNHEPYLQTLLERLGLNFFHFYFIGFYSPSLISAMQILFI